MHTAHLVLVLVAVALNGFSGTAAVLRFPSIIAGMAQAGVPESWLVFPIGALKLAGAAGLLAGLVWAPVGIAAATGLVLFFVCALYTHVLARDFPVQFALAIGFLALNATVLALAITSR